MNSNKKWLQFIATIWILIFHLWIMVSGTVAEQFVVRIGYVGVDIFFFVSAYSLATREIDYKGFLINRAWNIYGTFFLFTILAAVLKHWSGYKIITTLTFLDFFKNGGGAFLWFVPAIMLFYVLYPLFLKWKSPYKVIYVLVAWIVFTCISQYGFGYTRIFIFTNRLPVLLLGYYLKKHRIPKLLGWLCLPAGFLIMYYVGFRNKLQTPIKDVYFIGGVILVIGIAQLCSVLKSNKIIDVIAKSSLEVYGFQMVLGPRLVNKVYMQTRNIMLTNCIVLLVVIAAAILLQWGRYTCHKIVTKGQSS